MGMDLPVADKKLELKGQSIVVYDLEIKNPIDGKEVTWTNYRGMGISVGVSFDYRSYDFRIFCDDNMGELAEQLNSAEIVAGFNHSHFDNKLLRGCGYPLKEDTDLNLYDIYLESRYAMGWTAGQYFPKGLKLDDHLEAMFGKSAMKLGHGAHAPELYQAGKWGELLTYGLGDVKRECMVFEHIWEHGWVATPTYGKRYIRKPQELVWKRDEPCDEN